MISGAAEYVIQIQSPADSVTIPLAKPVSYQVVAFRLHSIRETVPFAIMTSAHISCRPADGKLTVGNTHREVTVIQHF